MKPAQLFSGYVTYDLTEGKIHKITEKDGTTRFAVMFPETWEPVGDKMKLGTVNGTMHAQQYKVLTWREHKLTLEEGGYPAG